MDKLILPAFHLLALLSFITYKTKTPFVQFMQKRFRDVSEGLNRSKTQMLEAESKRQEIEAKLSTLEAEKAKIKNEWAGRQAQQKELIEESSRRVIFQMRDELEQNKKALEISYRTTILKNFSRTILVQAENKIKQGLNVEVHHALNEAFAKNMSQGGPGA